MREVPVFLCLDSVFNMNSIIFWDVTPESLVEVLEECTASIFRNEE
jgi:hypothetical protein